MSSQLNRVSPYRSPSGAQKPFFAKSLFFAARAGVVKPRQPLCDLNPFDSVFLILGAETVKRLQLTKEGRRFTNRRPCSFVLGEGSMVRSPPFAAPTALSAW